MNKRYLYIFCTVGLLLLALVAVMLIESSGGWTSKVEITLSAATNQTKDTEQNNTTQEQSTLGQAEQIAGNEQKPTFDVEFGVGGRPQVNATTEAPEEQKPPVTTDPTTTQPTQEQNTEATQPPVTGESGMPDVLLTYEQFIQLSEDEQDAYFLQFADPRDYAAWLRKAKKEYEDNQTSIIITGPIDLSTLPVDAG